MTKKKLADLLLRKVVRFTLGADHALAGTRSGYVRRRAGSRLTVTLPSDPDAGHPIERRYRGQKVRIHLDDVGAVRLSSGRAEPVQSYLRRRGGSRGT